MAMGSVGTPAAVPQSTKSWVLVRSEYVEAVDLAPLSVPANDPATLAEPLAFGSPNPMCWAASLTMA